MISRTFEYNFFYLTTHDHNSIVTEAVFPLITSGAHYQDNHLNKCKIFEGDIIAGMSVRGM